MGVCSPEGIPGRLSWSNYPGCVLFRILLVIYPFRTLPTKYAEDYSQRDLLKKGTRVNLFGCCSRDPASFIFQLSGRVDHIILGHEVGAAEIVVFEDQPDHLLLCLDMHTPDK
ncbi:MAG: hypothetical protein BWY93_01832 [Euryarchaeota archaeon ADurb.BinA087]|nr:MAG: hypothetical protein BWY93_01832 [Euryarchaeota archaeon ADurb.BinA087]